MTDTEIVAIHEALGNEGHDLAAEEPERTRHERGGAHAVHVVIAVHENGLSRPHGLREPFDSSAHVEHLVERQELVETRAQVALRGFRRQVPARGEKPADHFGKVELRPKDVYRGLIRCRRKDPAGSRTGDGGSSGHVLKLFADVPSFNAATDHSAA